jgi:addiction module HigA family antidote
MAGEKFINEGGINGSGTAFVDTDSEDFKQLQAAIQAVVANYTPEEKLKIDLFALEVQLKAYLRDTAPVTFVSTGAFLKKFVKALGIKHKGFASYIEQEESNLSALFSGKRRINIDLALKLGKIFQLDPALWLQLQSKNDLLQMAQADKGKYEKYSLQELLRQAG